MIVRSQLYKNMIVRSQIYKNALNELYFHNKNSAKQKDIK